MPAFQLGRVWCILAAYVGLLPLGAFPTSAQTPGYWFRRSPLPTARQEILPCLLNEKIYAIGGYLPNLSITGLCEVYDPATALWSTACPIAVPRHHYAIGTVNGLLFVISGYTSATLPWTTTTQVQAYDPQTDEWTDRSPIPVAVGESGSVVFGDKIYVIGGHDPGGQDIDLVQVYDPAQDVWSSTSPMPTARHHPGVAVIDSLIYVAGGRTGYWGQVLTLTGVLEAYSPASDTWYQLPEMLTPRSALSAAAYGGRLYAFGGEYPSVYGNVEEYDPVTNEWRALTPMLTPRHGTGAVVVADSIFIIGGGAAFGADLVSDANEVFVLGSCLESDYDGFGIPGALGNTCPDDNCLHVYNPDQTDGDQDGSGDPCDGCPDDPLKSWEGICGCSTPDSDSDGDWIADCVDVCLGHDDRIDTDHDEVADGCDNCPGDYNPDQSDGDLDNVGDVCDGCCTGRVGNVNSQGDYPDEISLGDVMLLVDAKFISGDCGLIPCVAEADVNQDGGPDPSCDDHVTLGDVMVLVDFLFITGPEVATLAECL